MTSEEMQAAVRNFADLYRDMMATACNRIIVSTDDPILRRRAHHIKLNGATAMYDIAVQSVPANAMIDSVVMVTLQNLVVERNGHMLFPDQFDAIHEQTKDLQNLGYQLAARVMDNDQRTQLLSMCQQWVEEHPDQNEIWYIRLEDLPGVTRATANEMLDSLTNIPSKFLGAFNPFSKAGTAMSDASVVAERMAWLTPRLMILAQWRAEAIIYDTLATNEVTDAFADAAALTAVAQELPELIKSEREAIEKFLVDDEGSLKDLLTEVQGVTTDATAFAQASNTTLGTANELTQAVDAFMQRIQEMQEASRAAEADEPKPTTPSKPFDITEYTAALNALNQAAASTRQLAVTLDQSTTEEALEAKLGVIEARAVRFVLITAVIVLGGVVATIAAWKFIPSRRPRG